MSTFRELIEKRPNQDEMSVIYDTTTNKQVGKVYPTSKKAHDALNKMGDDNLKVASQLFFIDNIKGKIV